MLWLIIYVFTQLFQYVMWPLVMMFYYHAIFRAWNYLIEKNRTTLSNVNYAGMVRYSKQVALRLMIIFGVVTTLWVTAFGLHQEYAVPVMVVDVNRPTDTVAGDAAYEYSPAPSMDSSTAGQEGQFDQDTPGWLSPAAWPADAEIVLYLNELGAKETRLRSGPGIAGYNIIELLWDNDKLVYLHAFFPDPYVRGLYWLRVLSPSGTEGYVSSQLVGVNN